MPKKKPKKGPKLGPIIAGLGPAALALLLKLLGMATIPAPAGVPPLKVAGFEAAICESVTNMDACHSRYPTGCSKAGRYDPYLNILKNQVIAPPTPSQTVKFLDLNKFQKLDEDIPDGLSGDEKNHALFAKELGKLGEKKMFGVVGYLYYVNKSDEESSNCQLPDKDPEGTNVDYHIGIGFDADFAAHLRATKPSKLTKEDRRTLKTTSIIVEMTPHVRAEYGGEAWNYTALKQQVGKQVRVVGQLMVDSEHNVPEQNCAKATSQEQLNKCWRVSAWELHPVTQFQVCNKADQLCTASSADWVQPDQVNP